MNICIKFPKPFHMYIQTYNAIFKLYVLCIIVCSSVHFYYYMMCAYFSLNFQCVVCISFFLFSSFFFNDIDANKTQPKPSQHHMSIFCGYYCLVSQVWRISFLLLFSILWWVYGLRLVKFWLRLALFMYCKTFFFGRFCSLSSFVSFVYGAGGHQIVIL